MKPRGRRASLERRRRRPRRGAAPPPRRPRAARASARRGRATCARSAWTRPRPRPCSTPPRQWSTPRRRAPIPANSELARCPGDRSAPVRPGALLASRTLPTTPKEDAMTKSEFVDQVASASGLSKKDADSAVDAVLSTIEDTLRRGERRQLHRLRQVPRRRARRPRGPQPAHGRDDDDRRERSRASRPARASRRPSSRPAEPGAGDLTGARFRRPARAPRRRARVADRPRDRPRPGAASWPQALDARRAPPTHAGGRPRSRDAVAPPLPRADRRRRAGVRRRQAAARLLRAARRARLARRSRPPASTRARAGLLVLADGKRGDVPVTAAAYAQALVGEHADAVRRRRRASAPTRSPPTRCSGATRSSR